MNERNSAIWAMLLFSLSVYVYLFNFYCYAAYLGWVEFVSLFINASYDFGVLLVGLMVQLAVYQLFVHEGRYHHIKKEFRQKPENFQSLQIGTILYALGSVFSLISFVLILDYTSRLA